MNLLNRRVTLLVTVVLLNSATTNAQSFRPSNKVAQPGESSLTSANSGSSQIIARVNKSFETVPALKAVSEEARAILLGKYPSNKMIQGLYSGAAQALSVGANDSTINEIVTLKMEIAAAISTIDINSPTVEASIGRDQNMQAQYIMGYLLSKINPNTMSVESRATVLSLYRNLKEQLEISGSDQSSQALINTLESLGNVTGLYLTIDELLFAIQAEKNGTGELQGLFLSVHEVQSMEVGSINGKELRVLISPAELKKIADATTKDYWDMIHAGETQGLTTHQKNHGGSVESKLHSSALDLSQKLIRDNDLLNRPEAALNGYNETIAEVGASHDDLIKTLEKLGGKIENKGLWGKAGNLLNKVGFEKAAKWVNNKEDLAAQKRSLRSKIETTENILNNGLKQIEKDNETLNKLRSYAIEAEQALQRDAIRLKLMTDDYMTYIKELAAKDPEKAKIMNVNVGQPLQRQMNYILTMLITLRGAIDSYNTTIMIGLTTIQNSKFVILGLIPAMALTESQHSAIAMQDAHLLRLKATMSAYEKQMLRLSKLSIESAERSAQMAQDSIINPEVLDEVRANNELAAKIFIDGRDKAVEILNQQNQKMVESLNRTRNGTQNIGVSATVNNILHGKK